MQQVIDELGRLVAQVHPLRQAQQERRLNMSRTMRRCPLAIDSAEQGKPLFHPALFNSVV